jgi:hypothetical protein
MIDRRAGHTWLVGIVLAAWAALAALPACSSGGGPIVTTTGGGRDEPGTTRDTPPATRDAIGGDCLRCDTDYTCTGGKNPGNVRLSSSEGSCTQGLIDLVCSGALFGANGCVGGGGGPFTCGNVSCVPTTKVQ